MLAILLYPKLGKKYTFLMSTVWSLLPYKTALPVNIR